jgi:hypothetical protein
MTVTGTPQIIGTNATATSRTISPQAVTEANSISFNIIAGTGAFTITGTHAVRNIDFTDGVNPTGFAGSFGNTSSTIYGNLKASTGMTRNAGGTLTFAATSGTKSITTAGVTFACSLTFNGIGGTFAFQDALTQPSGRTFTITNGTVQLKSGATSTVGSFVANNANAKSLQSTTPSTQATLSQASGTVNVADLTIRDINATGGAAWNAYVDFENTDAGNNDGWDFGLSPPYASYEPPIIIRSFTQPRRF